MECRICNSSQFSQEIPVKEMMFGSGKEYTYLQCSNCGALQIKDIVTDNKLLYPKDYYSFNLQSKLPFTDRLKKFIFARIVKHELGKKNLIGHFFSKARHSFEARAVKEMIYPDQQILDVGCGNGAFVEALASLGFKHVEGIDPFIPKDIFGKHFIIHKKFLAQLEKPSVFDVIMLNHSFEHMAEPGEILQTIFKLLAPGGKCIIRIPVSDSYAFEKYGRNWVQLDAPRHVFLHTNKSIQFLAHQNGFTVDSIIDDSFELQFIGSEQYIKGISLNSPNSFYHALYKNWIGQSKHPFTKNELKNFLSQSRELNKQGKGDQRIFVLKKDTLKSAKYTGEKYFSQK